MSLQLSSIDIEGVCFGCGSANQKGLQLKPYAIRDWKGVSPDRVSPNTHNDRSTPTIALETFWCPTSQTFAGHPNILYGGTIASLFDCLGNWVASVNMCRGEMEAPGSGKFGEDDKKTDTDIEDIDPHTMHANTTRNRSIFFGHSLNGVPSPVPLTDPDFHMQWIQKMEKTVALRPVLNDVNSKDVKSELEVKNGINLKPGGGGSGDNEKKMIQKKKFLSTVTGYLNVQYLKPSIMRATSPNRPYQHFYARARLKEPYPEPGRGRKFYVEGEFYDSGYLPGDETSGGKTAYRDCNSIISSYCSGIYRR